MVPFAERWIITMKIDKLVQKNCILRIKEIAVDCGYKKNQNTIYKIENENIIFVDFLFINFQHLSYRISVKKYSFDTIFWKIMGMEENIKKGDVLRVRGAFAAPAVLIAKGKIELSENVDTVAAEFLKRVNEDINVFLEKYDVIEYIFSHNEIVDLNILKCLSYIDLNLICKAKELAKSQILVGEKGRFENKGKGFFELVLLYCN